jgi:hypothetical protein
MMNLTRLQLMLTARDFTGDDYEVLSRLDEEDEQQQQQHPMGGTQEELDRLPVYTVESEWRGSNENSKCFICLNDFAKGDVVRILPCLHQFHQAECADPWLRRKMLCPTCKLMF